MKKLLLWIVFIFSLIYGILYYIQYKETEKFDRIISQQQKNVSENNRNNEYEKI